MRIAAVVLAALIWALPVDAQDSDPDGLPEGAGREEVRGYCGACHSLRLVTQQGLSRDVWTEVLDYMTAEQEMPALPAADRTLVLNYLSQFFGQDRLARAMSGGAGG